MTRTMKASTEQIVAAYRETGSVWKAGLALGMAGQSIHERLAAIGYPLRGRNWTREELDELRRLAGNMPIGEIAERLGRPYAGIACKLSRLGITARRPGRKAPPRGSGYDKQSAARYMRDLERNDQSLRQFCIERGLSIDSVVYTLELHHPERWQAWRRTRSDLQDRECDYCRRPFTPMTKKQTFCSRKCQGDKKRDDTYFNGNRRNTIGLAEATCQLCGRENVKGLSSHHVFGKENDPDGEVLIALCPGCHQLVGRLAGRRFLRDERGWEALISLAFFRANGTEHAGVHVCVDIDPLTEDDIRDDPELNPAA